MGSLSWLRRPAVVGWATLLLTFVLLATPYRDDYSETGPDPGIRYVSLLSDQLDRSVDGLTLLVALAWSLVAGGCAAALVVTVALGDDRGEGGGEGRPRE